MLVRRMFPALRMSMDGGMSLVSAFRMSRGHMRRSMSESMATLTPGTLPMSRVPGTGHGVTVALMAGHARMHAGVHGSRMFRVPCSGGAVGMPSMSRDLMARARVNRVS